MQNLIKTSLQFDKEQLDFLLGLSRKKKISTAGIVRMIVDDFRSRSDFDDFINSKAVEDARLQHTPAPEAG